MSGQSSSPLKPTFEGHTATTLDALVLVESCVSGELNHVPRRPHDRERQDLIKSGNIFIYEEHASGIKRWTDGVSWSPSRILGNFLIYRELDKPFPPGEKKRALKKRKSPTGGISKQELSSRSSINGYALASLDTSSVKDTERALIGSLVDSYPFKKNGLIKKTISITLQGIPHHMVSYYTVSDVVSGRLITPSRHPLTMNIIPRAELIMSQNFRAPIDEVEYGPEERGGPPPMFTTTAMPNAHDFGNGSGTMLQRTVTLPSFPSVPSAYDTTSYAYNPHHHYTSSIGSAMPPSMAPQAMSSATIQPQPLPLPPSHMHHHSASSLQPPVSAPMPSTSSSSQLSYAPHQQGNNYSLDPQRAAVRFGSDSSLLHTFPRHMPPTHDTSRRSSTYEVPQPSGLSSLPLGSVTDGRSSSNGAAYMRQASYYLPPHSASMATPENSVFSHHRPIKAETELPPLPPMEDGSQQYDLDESNSAWTFEGIDNNSQAQPFFEAQASGDLSSWHEAPNGVGRS
ncbi:hypothetical protein E4U43_000235 [Claviceps pusilla]|uniref:Uncharacterized protein n=1 Tax=Claviceps pusilla TaxID=123648 RepID=A0A9P7NAB5_9HYPO|nr:hypothetical protein E4U43_000235 [Claviceps pusilla]